MQFLRSLLLCLATFALVVSAYALLTIPSLHGPAEVAPGVTLEVAKLDPTDTGRGRMYLAKAALDPAQLDLFVTSPDPTLQGSAYTHRIRHSSKVAADNNLSVVVNATIFTGGTVPFRRAGQVATIIETTISNFQIAHWWQYSYMLGFTPTLAPEPLTTRPPPFPESAQTFPRWKWGIGSQNVVTDGTHISNGNSPVQRQTVLGLDRSRTHFCLAVFQNATTARMGSELLARDIDIFYVMDGSESSSMSINALALTGDWRPVATHVGVARK